MGEAEAMDQLKRQAAEAALLHIRSGMTVGLGSGSTARHFIQALAEGVATGHFTDLRGLPTSRESETLAREAGIPLVDFADVERCDVVVDGADEVDPQLELIKGLGGALLREKVVAQNAGKRVIIVDESKRVPRLGTKSALPVEVTPFGHEIQPAFFRSLGATVTLRGGESAFQTDNGNYIYDLKFPADIADPRDLEAKLLRRAGVVETGLFLGMADVVIVAARGGIVTLQRSNTN